MSYDLSSTNLVLSASSHESAQHLDTAMAAEPRSSSSRGTLQVDGSPRPLGGLSFRVQGGHSSRPQSGLSSRESSRRGPGTVSSSPRGATEPQYTVYIRLPFPRNGFVDPPRVCLRVRRLEDAS